MKPRKGHDFEFVAPDGKIHRGNGVKRFARDNDLDKSCLQRVHDGSRSSHKGWKANESFYMGV